MVNVIKSHPVETVAVSAGVLITGYALAMAAAFIVYLAIIKDVDLED